MSSFKILTADAARLRDWRADHRNLKGSHDLRQFQAFNADKLVTVTVIVEGTHEACMVTVSQFLPANYEPLEVYTFNSLYAAVDFILGSSTYTGIGFVGMAYFENVREAFYAEDYRRKLAARETFVAPAARTNEGEAE